MSSLDCRQEGSRAAEQMLPPVPDNFSYVVPVEDELEHTPLHPFCHDKTCACHEDSGAIAAVNQAVQDGLITPEEATYFVLGKLL